EEVAFQALQIGIPEALAGLRRGRQSGRCGGLRRALLADCLLSLRQEEEDSRRAGLIAGPTHQGYSVENPAQRGSVARRNRRRVVKRAPQAEPQWKALRLAQRDHLHGAPALTFGVAAERMQRRFPEQREREAERVLEALGKANGLFGAGQRGIRPPEVPEGPGGVAEPGHGLVRAQHARQRMVSRRVVESQRALAVCD